MSAELFSTHTAWLQLLDWRRQLSALYSEVRHLSQTDPAGAHQFWQHQRQELFSHHPQTPLPAPASSTEGAVEARLPAYWPYDPKWRLSAPVQTDLEPLRLVVPSSTGQDMPLVRFGRVALPQFGSLDIYWIDVYGGGVFLPFRDSTAGVSTYGGGRYLLDTAKSADLGSLSSGELVLDFNFAYHPSCFYDSRWSCPLAPLANRLEVAIEAGEKVP